MTMAKDPTKKHTDRKPIHRIYLSETRVSCEIFDKFKGKGGMAEAAMTELHGLAAKFGSTLFSPVETDEAKAELEKLKAKYGKVEQLDFILGGMLHALDQD